MKILAFTDIHESLSCRKKVEALMKNHNPEVVVCAGDFTVFEQHFNDFAEISIQFIERLGL